MVSMNITCILRNSNEIEVTRRFYQVASFLNGISSKQILSVDDRDKPVS